MFVLAIVTGWVVLSVPFGLVVGAALHRQSESCLRDTIALEGLTPHQLVALGASPAA